MAGFVARRFLQMVAVLLGASVVLFACLFLLPGDPVSAQQGAGREIDASTRQLLEKRYHLDEPLPAQYAGYLSRLARGDMGESYTFRRPVNDVLGEKFVNTMKLALVAIGLQVAMGVAAGLVAAVSRFSLLDILVTLATTIAIGIPTFVIGQALQEVFAVNLDLLPLSRIGGPRSYFLPAITIASVETALVARLARGAILEVLGADFVRTARGKGLRESAVIVRHALRSSMIPIVTYLGVSFGAMLGGALITETIFQWDGVGLALVNAIRAQDNPVVLGAVSWGVLAFVVVSFLVDLAYAALDPRVRLSR